MNEDLLREKVQIIPNIILLIFLCLGKRPVHVAETAQAAREQQKLSQTKGQAEFYEISHEKKWMLGNCIYKLSYTSYVIVIFFGIKQNYQ